MKTLLTSALIALALTGCGTYVYEAEMFPGGEATMVALCEANGGFKRGTIRAANNYFGRGGAVALYRTEYNVECNNGARISRTFERQP